MATAGTRTGRRWRVGGQTALGLLIVLALFVAAVFAPAIAPHDPYATRPDHALQAPGGSFWFGTDALGQDIASRVVYGARISLWIALGAVGLACVLGIPVGAVAGYAGGRIDTLLMRAADMLMALPSIVLALTITAALGRGLINVVIAVGIAESPRFARQMRAAVLELRERDFVLAARALGASPPAILWRHILPGALGPLIVIATLGLGTAVLDAAGLGFLGLGAEPGTPEWGTMLSDNVAYLRDYPWICLYPGLAIAATVLGFNLLGDGLRAALDPRSG
ncbi:MAG: ABC transporter permease [Planctomycetota bacterium]|nr:MAG: ABC transporter permease [Planctomycetota bacterium]